MSNQVALHLFIIAGCVLGFCLYIRGILRLIVKPSRSSWILWTVLTAMTGGSMYQAGTLNIQVFLTFVGNVIVLVMCIWYGKPGWTKIDIVSLAAGGVGIVLWVITTNFYYGLIISLAVDVIASVPTFTKTWHYPHEEDALAWAVPALTSVASTIAVPEWTIAHAAAPIMYALIQGTVFFLIIIKPKRFFAPA